MMAKPSFKPELLLPAGDFSSVAAAVQNGADAVYLGGRNFSARQNARNFDGDELCRAVCYCHARGVKVYQTLNTLLFDSQLEEAGESVRLGCSLGMDAFIVQDWGLLSFLRERCPQMRVHGSTQMTVHTLRGARLLAEMGAERVVLSRELSLEEIREISQNAGIETEVFVHGALCMSVSGQCYLSGMIGGRSGNRGSCAGACRLPWTAAEGRPDPARDYALSLKDLCLLKSLPELEAAGVASLKVEGRMKRPEYVAAAARAYRDALDGRAPDAGQLQAVFARGGFTDGYLTGKRGTEMFGFRRREDVVAATPKVLRAVENTYRGEHGRIPLDFHLEAKSGSPLRLTASDREGHSASAEGFPPQAAEAKPSTAEGLRASLQKLGGTIFTAGDCAVEAGEGLFIPAAELNGLRRRLCGEIQALRETPRPIPFLKQPPSGKAGWERPEPPPYPALWARFSRFDQIPLEETDGFSRFSLPAGEAEAHAGELAPWRDRLLIEPERALFGREEETLRRLRALREQGFSHLLCENLSHAALARALSMRAHGGPFLNCTNTRSAETLVGLLMEDQTLSFELNLRDARGIAAPIPLGLVSYGYLPLLLTRNCPVRIRFSCRDCGGTKFLTDRTGKRFRVLCHGGRFAEVLNGDVLWMGDRMEELRGFAFHTLYFTVESREECRKVLRRYARGLPCGGGFTRGLYYRKI